jgi:uncharacterized protein
MATLKTTRAEILPQVWLDSRRAVYFEDLNAVVVGDLHWGYAVSHRAAGNLLPIWGDEIVAQSLRSLLNDYRPREMIWLGDCLHALAGKTSAEAFLQELTRSEVTVTILCGNHDRRWSRPTERVLRRGRYVFHHGDQASPELAEGEIEVVGHFHPAAGLYDGAGTRLRLPALVASAQRLILPAFSPWAAGLVWNDRLQPTEILWAVAPSRIFAVRSAQSRPKAG